MYKITVIIPSWNAEKYIEETLESILAQTYPAHKILIIDDCSTDGTSDIIGEYVKRYPQVKSIRLDVNGGPASARNIGIQNLDSDTDFVAFCDSDDVWHPDKLQRQIDVFKHSDIDNLGIVYCANNVINESKEYEPASSSPVNRGYVHHNVAAGAAVHGSMSSIMVRVNVFKQITGFDEQINYDEDFDFLFRVSDCYNFDFVPEVVVSLRRHQGNRSGLFETLLTSKSYLINKHYDYYQSHRRFIRKLRLDILKDIWIKMPQTTLINKLVQYGIHVSNQFFQYDRFFEGQAKKLIFHRSALHLYLWGLGYGFSRIKNCFFYKTRNGE